MYKRQVDNIALSLLEVFDQIVNCLDLDVENICNLLICPFTRDSKLEYSHTYSYTQLSESSMLPVWTCVLLLVLALTMKFSEKQCVSVVILITCLLLN